MGPKRTLLLVSIAAAALAAGGSLLQRVPAHAAARTNPYAGQERAARAGRKLFLRECAECHGEEGQGIGKRPPLATPLVHDAQPGAVEWVIRNGSMRGGMPSFSHLPAPERWQIVTYVQSMPPPRGR